MGADFFFSFSSCIWGTSRLGRIMFCLFVCFIKSRPFVGKQSLVSRYKEVSSGNGSSSRNRAWSERDLVGSHQSDGTLERMPKPLTGVSGTELNLVCSTQIRWMEVFLLLNFTHSSFTNEWFRGLCHTPGKLVWLPFFKSVCLVTYFSKTISLPGNHSAFSCILVLAHYVRGKCQQTWRRPEKLVNIEKCAFGLHMFNFFFF